jgi:hypothetical protein
VAEQCDLISLVANIRMGGIHREKGHLISVKIRRGYTIRWRETEGYTAG